MGYKKNDKINCNITKTISHLHRIEGQVKSIEKMYNEKRDVEEIIRVVLAARASLDSVTKFLLNDKVNGCFGKYKNINKKELKKFIDIFFKIT